MKTNDCLRRVRYILDLHDKDVIALFAQAEQRVTRAQVIAWLKKDDDPDYEECSDVMFATFLNGLINQRRGKQDGQQPKPEESMNNNLVFKKLKIAFKLQAQDILVILSLADLNISKHELSALFRRPDHKHYRACKDQILRNFLTGLQIKYRGTSQ
ncbi:MAG: DUF1456 family protein [Gammaproteobacteria bacterium]|nr:DUF1456 family protein [Gammaproteobacteria bacterium]